MFRLMVKDKTMDGWKDFFGYPVTQKEAQEAKVEAIKMDEVHKLDGRTYEIKEEKQ